MTSSGCHYVKVLSTAGYSLVAFVTDLRVCCHVTYDSREHGICSSRIISEMLPEIQTIEKCNALKTIIHSQTNQFSVITCSTMTNPKYLDAWQQEVNHPLALTFSSSFCSL